MLLADIASTGIIGAESGNVTLGDKVAVFAQGPIGICASIGARLLGASVVIGVDGDDHRLAMAKRMGVDVVLDYRKVDVVSEIRRLTGGVDVAIEALGTHRRSRARCALSVRAARSRAWACTPASSRFRATRSAPASRTTAS